MKKVVVVLLASLQLCQVEAAQQELSPMKRKQNKKLYPFSSFAEKNGRHQSTFCKDVCTVGIAAGLLAQASLHTEPAIENTQKIPLQLEGKPVAKRTEIFQKNAK